MKAAFVLHDEEVCSWQSCGNELGGRHGLSREREESRLERRNKEPMLSFVECTQETFNTLLARLLLEACVEEMLDEGSISLKEFAVNAGKRKCAQGASVGASWFERLDESERLKHDVFACHGD
ncbi:MAG TPA: hypothetical protein VGM84_28625 [Steroidobacteraceae bacterium]